MVVPPSVGASPLALLRRTSRRGNRVACGQLPDDFSNTLGQRLGFEDGGMGAAGGECGDLLRGVPEAAAEHVGGPGVKFDDDVVVALAFQHGEAAAEVL